MIRDLALVMLQQHPRVRLRRPEGKLKRRSSGPKLRSTPAGNGATSVLPSGVSQRWRRGSG